jgi:hypothetical protein
VVPKAKHDSLNTHDLMGYDNVPIDSVEAVVSLLGRWVCQKTHAVERGTSLFGA